MRGSFYKIVKSEGLAILPDATSQFSNPRYHYQLLSIDRTLENDFLLSNELALLFQYHNRNVVGVLRKSLTCVFSYNSSFMRFLNLAEFYIISTSSKWSSK